MTEEKIPVYMTPEDIELFKYFQKYYRFIKLLETKGVFTTKRGYLTIRITTIPGEIGSFDFIEKGEHTEVLT